MRRKLEELKDTLAEFVDQRDHLVLVVGTTDEEVLYVLKTLEGVDAETPSDLYMVFAQDAVAAPAYATSVAAAVDAQLEGANAARAAKGEARWPALPPRCYDPRVAPAARMRAAIDHVRALLPPEEDHRLVWALLPLRVHDPAGYAEIVGQLVPRDGFEPWMRALRVVVRDDRGAPFLAPALRRAAAQGVLLYDPDLSPAALADALATEALDPATPAPDRMQALVQLAALDYAHQRYPEALEKWGLLFEYYTQHAAPAMQALCLQGAGDVLRRVGRAEAARERYQQGLALAADAHALPVALNLASAAGETSLALGHHDDALGYFDLADRLAAKLLNPFAKAEAMAHAGEAHHAKGDPAAARRQWREAAEFCRAVGFHDRLVAVLERLAGALREPGMEAERLAVETELRAAQAGVTGGAR